MDFQLLLESCSVCRVLMQILAASVPRRDQGWRTSPLPGWRHDHASNEGYIIDGGSGLDAELYKWLMSKAEGIEERVRLSYTRANAARPETASQSTTPRIFTDNAPPSLQALPAMPP